MKAHKQPPTTASQGLVHTRKIKTTFTTRHPFISSLFHPKVLLLEGLLLVGMLASNKAFAQAPVTPVKAPTEQTGKMESETPDKTAREIKEGIKTGKITEEDRIAVAVLYNVVAIEQSGEERAQQLLTPFFKQMGMSDALISLIFRTVSANVRNGISNVETITDAIMNEYKSQPPVKPAENKQKKIESAPVIAAQTSTK